MIYVAKSKAKIPPAFAIASRDEMARLLPLFARARGGRSPKVEFRAYRNADLKRGLEALFHHKCAYCEATYAIAGYMEVEHYRPKNLYYWLAADWSNLLPSCKKCNNGKLSKFPLDDPSKQARKKGDETHESPLLLNPSDPVRARRPDRHLTFDPTDGAVRALAVRGQSSRMGVASIAVYRLARSPLSQDRKSWSLRVRAALAFVRGANRGGASSNERELAYQNLKDLLAPGQPYRALTLQILRQSGFTSLREASDSR